MLIFEIIVICLFLIFFIGGFLTESERGGYFITAFSIFIVMLILFFHTTPSAEGKEPIYKEIVSLERGSEVSGSFILGFGTIDTRVVYYAYQDLGQSRYDLLTIPRITITETDSRDPAYVYNWKCERPFIFNWCNVTENTIYVPKGTIQKKFNG